MVLTRKSLTLLIDLSQNQDIKSRKRKRENEGDRGKGRRLVGEMATMGSKKVDSESRNEIQKPTKPMANADGFRRLQ